MAKIESDKISDSELKEALGRSGYLLEQRLERVLESEGYNVSANHSYEDKRTGISREMDILAWRRSSSGSSEDVADFNVLLDTVLLIESSNNTQPIVLFDNSRSPLGEKGSHLFVPHCSFSEKATFAVFRAYECHHYSSERFSTQYCSFTKKKSDKQWFANHPEDSTGDIRKLCDELWYEKLHADKMKDRLENRKAVYLRVFHLVYVVQNDLILASQQEELELKPLERGIIRQGVASEGRFQSLFINVVTEKGFLGLLNELGGAHDKVFSFCEQLMGSAKGS